MRSDPSRELRDRIHRRARALQQEALSSEAAVSEARLEELERLARVAEIAEAARPPPRRGSLPLALGATLLLASVLVVARCPQTEVEVEVEASEVGFVAAAPQTLIETSTLGVLAVSGLRQIRLPRARGRAAEVLEVDAAGFWRLAGLPGGEPPGRISLMALTVPAGIGVRLDRTELPRSYHLGLTGAALEIQAAIEGRVEIARPGAPPGPFEFPRPARIVMSSGPEGVELDLMLRAGDGLRFPPLLDAEQLSFSSIHEIERPERTVVRRMSTLLGGTLYDQSIGRQRRLRAGEALRFAESRGEIRSLRLRSEDGEDRIALRFQGRASGLSTGTESHRRDLMPTSIEWLAANHRLKLLWGATVYVFGLWLAARRWWRNPT